MGRHSVLPHARRRAQHACEACRLSKRKCDAFLPCYNCIKKGASETCAPAASGKSKTSPGGSSLVSSIHVASADRREEPPDDDTSPRWREAANSQLRRDEISGPGPEADSRRASADQGHRMLLSARGERIFIGSTGALSFLQLLRRTMRVCNGPSPFTESQSRHTMLEAEAPLDSGPFSDTLHAPDKRDLVEYFLQASSGFIHVFTDEEISELLALPPHMGGDLADSSISGVDQDRLASLYAMIAVGAQCRGHGPADTRTARLYFSQAYKITSRNMMIEPDINMVRNFLLLGFFMCCACRRNTAMLYLGIAARTATILGLHLPEPPQLPPEYIARRRRVWRSLRVYDLLCNAILGRPSGTDSVQLPDTDPGPNAHDNSAAAPSHGELALNANYQNCAVIQSISQTLMRRDNHMDQETAEDYLQTLKTWARGLPEALRDSHSGRTGSQARRRSLGNVHVSCGYYYTVILVTRPFLVSRILPTLQHGGRQSTGDDGKEGDSRRAARTLGLSRTCLSSAVFLVQCCQDAASLDLLLGNMCILQAWVFAAGLVLGFSLLHPGICSHPDAESTFISSQRILQKVSRLSPQAQRYLEILTSFSDAVAAYNRRNSQPSTRASSEQVEQILPPVFQGLSSMHADKAAGLNDGATEGPLAQAGGTNFMDLFETSEGMDMTANPFGAQISDDLGFQQFWDGFTAGGGIDGAGELSGSSWAADSAVDIL